METSTKTKTSNRNLDNHPLWDSNTLKKNKAR